jgi:N-acetyl-anhydromuramyl-L-alanine amidase AmpD
MNIRQVEFPNSCYMQEEHTKTQVYLHHTAGNFSADQVVDWWIKSPEDVGTCVVIAGKGPNTKDGEIVQAFSSKHWAYHLGLRESTFSKYKVPYRSLDKISIGIEICNWGQLTLKDGKYYNYVNREVPKEEVIKLEKPHRGFQFYHNYTDAQIESVRQLLVLWNLRYGIPLKYNPDIFDITPRALRGEPGVYTHNSVRFDKVDVYPHPKLISMLQSLTKTK